tara:strand:- start:9555 stop:10511 length:957 start_codon:yes stop_codon:yes gene_type:complete
MSNISIISDSYKNKRIDQVLAELYPDFSRSILKKWLLEGKIKVDNKVLSKANLKVAGGETVELEINLEELENTNNWTPEDITNDHDLQIIYEDGDIIVVNKPIGLVVHPGAGNTHATLANHLLYKYPELEKLPRAGIVHRLDKDTSGLLVIARSIKAHSSLIKQLESRSVKRQYLALVKGIVIIREGVVNEDIARHPRNRVKMTVVESGKEAITHYKVETYFKNHTLLKLSLETGRTHQIRVHMDSINHGIVGDSLYGTRYNVSLSLYTESQKSELLSFKRQALHAFKLELEHPSLNKTMSFEAPIADDMQSLLADII